MAKKMMRARRTPKVTRKDSPTAATARKVTREAKPKTAYELCERVAKHIEEEPLRYHQGLWGFENYAIEDLARPQCGTVCCRAGWIVALHDGIGMERKGNVANRSDAILGYPDDSSVTMALYYDDGWVQAHEQGTKQYAKAGANGLRQWMKRNAAHLKARKLVDVPKLGKG